MSLREEQALIAGWIRDGSRVLDLGCGDGTLLAHLQTGGGVTGYGIEIDPENILRCLERGVILLGSGTYGNVMRFLFPLVITTAQLDEGLDVIEGVLQDLRG